MLFHDQAHPLLYHYFAKYYINQYSYDYHFDTDTIIWTMTAHEDTRNILFYLIQF